MDAADIADICNISMPQKKEPDEVGKIIASIDDILAFDSTSQKTEPAPAPAHRVDVESLQPVAEYSPQNSPRHDKHTYTAYSTEHTPETLLTDITRELNRDVIDVDNTEKSAMFRNINREISRLVDLGVDVEDLELPDKNTSLSYMTQLYRKHYDDRLTRGVEQQNTNAYVSIAGVLEQVCNGKRSYFGKRPNLKGLSTRVGVLMSDPSIDSAALFKRILKACGIFSDEGLLMLGLVTSVGMTLKDNTSNVENDIKNIE